MNGTTVVISVIVLSIGLLVGGVALASKINPPPVAVTTNVGVKATVVGSTDFNWGNLTLKSGPQTAVYQIKNDGTDALKLYNLETSCMCTTAQFKMGNLASPLFRMHTKSDYVLTVAPGQTAQVEAVFDPGFHGPAGVGRIDRQIKVATNDPKRESLTFTASADVRTN